MLLSTPQLLLAGDGLYAQYEAPWSVETLCAMLPLEQIILDDDGNSLEEEDPEFAVENNLQYALTSEEIEDVIANAKHQKRTISVEELVEALNYYYRHDAFAPIS